MGRNGWRKWGAAVAFVGLGVVGAVGSEAPAPGIGEAIAGLMLRLDGDGDDVLTRSEFDGGVLQGFFDMDADGDGKATSAEVGAFGERQAGDMGVSGVVAKGVAVLIRSAILTMDAGRDGAVDQKEFLDGVGKCFVRGDADGDGRQTKEELRALPGRLLLPKGKDGAGVSGAK